LDEGESGQVDEEYDDEEYYEADGDIDDDGIEEYDVEDIYREPIFMGEEEFPCEYGMEDENAYSRPPSTAHYQGEPFGRKLGYGTPQRQH
jgi:hypothetical protein